MALIAPNTSYLNRELPGTRPDQETRQLAVAPWSDYMAYTVEMRIGAQRSKRTENSRSPGNGVEVGGEKDPSRKRHWFTREDRILKVPRFVCTAPHKSGHVGLKKKNTQQLVFSKSLLDKIVG